VSEAFRGRAWLLVGGQSISTLGDALMLVVLPLAVLDLTGSVLQVSLFFVLTQVPAFVGVLAGTPRRRFAARSLLVAYDLGRAALALGIAALLAVDRGNIYLAYGLVFLAATLTALFHPTRIEYISHIVPEAALTRFNSYDRTLEAVAMAAGAGLGGLAYHALPLPVNFVLDAATFLLSGLSLLALRSPAGAGTHAPAVVATSLRAALSALRRRPVTRYLLGGETLTGVAFGVYTALFVVYVRRYLREGPIVFGNLEMVLAISATLAGFALGIERLRLSNRALVVVGYLGMGLAMLALGFTSTTWPVFPVIAALGVANMCYAVGVRTLLQTSSPPDERVHVFGLESVLSRTAQILGAGLAGVLLTASVLRVNWAIAIAGLLIVAAAVWGLRVLYVPSPGTVDEVEASVAAR
jgi:MFS transporter, NRE family, putaive nickel resistance protein